MARPQRRMAAEDRRMDQEEQMMRMDQAQQGLVRGDQQLAMNDEKMRAMQEAKRRQQEVDRISSEHGDYESVANALDGAGFREEATGIRKRMLELEKLKGELAAQDRKKDADGSKKWTENNNLWKDATGFSHIPEDQRAAAYPEKRRIFLSSPMGKEMAETNQELVETLWPEELGPGTLDLLANTNLAATLDADAMGKKQSKVDLERGQLNNMKDWEQFSGQQLGNTSTKKGWAAKRNQLLEQMPPEIRTQLEGHIPEEPSKEIRAYYRNMGKTEGATPASIQEYNFYKAQVPAGEKPMPYIEFQKPHDRDNLSPGQALAAARSVEGETKARMDTLNGDLAERTYPQALAHVAKERGWDMDVLYGAAMGQKPGAEPEAAPAVETRTGPEGQVYEKGADGLWREKK